MFALEMTKLFIHIGTHGRTIQRGTIRAHMKELRRTVDKIVRDFSGVGLWYLQMTLAKKLVTRELMHEEGIALTNMEFSMMLEELELLV